MISDFGPSHWLCKGSQEFVRITAQRMVSIARLFFNQQSHWLTFIHEEADVSTRLGQRQGFAQQLALPCPFPHVNGAQPIGEPSP